MLYNKCQSKKEKNPTILLETRNSQEVKEESVSKSKKSSRAEQEFKGDKQKDRSPFGE